MKIHGVDYPAFDSLGYTYLDKVHNPDGTITTFGYIGRLKYFIQKLWFGANDFIIVAVFKPKGSGRDI